MKTIKQIADEIGVSKQAVHKKIKQEPLSTSLQGLSINHGKGLQFPADGEKLIKQAFEKNEATTSKPSKPTTVNRHSVDMVDKLIESLQGQIKTLTDQNKDLREQLNKEREHSRGQADNITGLATELSRLANNAQQLHAIESVKQPPQLTDELTAQKKKGFFNRLFG